MSPAKRAIMTNVSRRTVFETMPGGAGLALGFVFSDRAKPCISIHIARDVPRTFLPRLLAGELDRNWQKVHSENGFVFSISFKSPHELPQFNPGCVKSDTARQRASKRLAARRSRAEPVFFKSFLDEISSAARQLDTAHRGQYDRHWKEP